MAENTVVFYEGPSTFDGSPIVGVLTGLALRSKNDKTGDMLQVWILHGEQSPTDAIISGADAAMCGDCGLRGDGKHGRGCYVTYWQAPMRIWSRLPDRPRVSPRWLGRRIAGEKLRLGAYGDPVAIPLKVWRQVLEFGARPIGYTQRWDRCDDGYRSFLMASVLSTVALEAARARGWRTYRVRGPKDDVLEHEMVCPASHESTHALTCAECMACGGGRMAARDVVIMAHGKPGNLAAFGVSLTPEQRARLTGRPPKRAIALLPV